MPFRSPLKSPFRWDPWHEMEDLRREVERVWRSMGRPATTAGVAHVPPADLCDTGAMFVLTVDLPGIRQVDLDITVEGSTLTVRGQRTADELKDGSHLYRERPVGRFERTVELPQDVDVDRVTAVLRLGVLEVTLPKGGAIPIKKVAVTLDEGSAVSRSGEG